MLGAGQAAMLGGSVKGTTTPSWKFYDEFLSGSVVKLSTRSPDTNTISTLAWNNSYSYLSCGPTSEAYFVTGSYQGSLFEANLDSNLTHYEAVLYETSISQLLAIFFRSLGIAASRWYFGLNYNTNFVILVENSTIVASSPITDVINTDYKLSIDFVGDIGSFKLNDAELFTYTCPSKGNYAGIWTHNTGKCKYLGIY